MLTKIGNCYKVIGTNNDDENEQNPRRKSTAWGEFTFYGETPQTPDAEENSVEIPLLSDTSQSFPLAMANVGERLWIVKLRGSEDMVRRLIGMGLVPGCEVEIISTTDGSVLVALCDTPLGVCPSGNRRIGLGVGVAQKIMCTNFDI